MIRTQMPECFHPLRLSHSCFTTPYSSLIDQAGITTFPVCGTLGFTEVPGDNEIGVWPPPPVSRHVCVSSCHRNGTCKAVSYAKQYKLCSYYSKYMKDDHLIEDGSSNFEHYDEVCRKRGYWESEDVSVVSIGLGDWGVMLLKYNDRFRVLLLLLLLLLPASLWDEGEALTTLLYELKVFCVNRVPVSCQTHKQFLRKAGWTICRVTKNWVPRKRGNPQDTKL